MKTALLVVLIGLSQIMCAQVKRVEAQLEIDVHEHLLQKAKNDTLWIYPDAKTLAGWIKSSALLEDCLKRNKKTPSGPEIAKTRTNLKAEVDETGKFLYVSFMNADANFGKNFMDTLIYTFNEFHLKKMYEKAMQQTEFLDRQLELAEDVKRTLNDACMHFMQYNRFLNFDIEKELLYEKITLQDSMRRTYEDRVSKLNELESYILADKPLYKEFADVLLGYRDLKLYTLFADAEHLNKKKDSTAALNKLIAESLSYIKELKRIYAGREQSAMENFYKTKNVYQNYEKKEEEYRELKRKQQAARELSDQLASQKTALLFRRSAIAPLVRISVLPHIVE